MEFVDPEGLLALGELLETEQVGQEKKQLEDLEVGKDLEEMVLPSFVLSHLSLDL